MISEDQLWDNQGTKHVIQLCGATEGHGPASLGLTKFGSLEKEIENHIVTWEPHEQYEKAKRYDTER